MRSRPRTASKHPARRRAVNHRLGITAFLGAIVLFAAPSLGQVAIRWSSIDCGGGRMTGGAFAIQGTIGQFDAGPVETGGPPTRTLTGGFQVGTNCPADYDANGIVSIDDLFIYIN